MANWASVKTISSPPIHINQTLPDRSANYKLVDIDQSANCERKSFAARNCDMTIILFRETTCISRMEDNPLRIILPIYPHHRINLPISLNSRGWMLQSRSWLPNMNVSWCTPNDRVYQITSTEEIRRIAFSWGIWPYQKERTIARTDWYFRISLGDLTFIPNQPRKAHEALHSTCGIQNSWNIKVHPKDVWTEQSITGPQWVARSSERPTALQVRLLSQTLGLGSLNSTL